MRAQIFSLSLPLNRLGSRAWTCARCRGGQRQVVPLYGSAGSSGSGSSGSSGPRLSLTPVCRYATSGGGGSSQGQGKQQGGGGGRPGRRRAVILAATGGSAAAGVLAFTDDIKQSYDAVERTGRVASALFICITDYRKTLKQRDTIDDPEEQLRLLKACHKRCAVRTLKVLEKNGGIFIKLGQHLSAMNYLLPPEWTSTFVPLQDRCPVSSFDSIQQMFRDDTGAELWEYFSEFASEPVGAASLAQVHLATVKESGQRVAVKVQHPGLAQWAPLDLALTKFTFSTLKRFFPEYDLEWLASEMELSLPQELDFRREAENAERTRRHFARIPRLPLVVPDVLWARQRILVMACESGHRLDDLAYLDANGIDRDEVSAALAHIFNEMIFGEGAPLHCDPHGGNLAIRRNDARRGRLAAALGGLGLGSLGGGRHNFDIVLYDHGLYRDIPRSLRRSYAKMWLAVLDGDMDRMRRYAKEVAGVDDEQFPLFASAITGRDYRVVSSASLLETPRTDVERDNMGGALQEGLLADLVQLLGRVPRIILLILKTNDLTRSLDESLHTRQGPARSFLILARYCMRTVYHERVEEIRAGAGGGGIKASALWPPTALRLLAAWLGFLRVEVRLEAFELWLGVKRLLGLRSGLEGGLVL